MNRPILLGAVVAILVVANVWRWTTPDGGTAVPATQAQQDGRSPGDDERMRLPLLRDDTGGEPSRDLFAVRQQQDEPAAKPEPPPPEPESAGTADEPARDEAALARRAAERELRSMQLAGTIARRNGRSAYLIHRGEAVIVPPGGTVGGRYRVEAVREGEVILRDGATGTSRRLTLRGQAQ